MTINRRIVLASRPQNLPTPENFALVEVPLPEIAEGEVLVRNLVFAIDPATRGMLDERESYMPPVAIGGVIPSMIMGQVVASRNPEFREGDHARGYVGWEEFSVLTPDNITIEKVRVDPEVPLTAYMGALGWSGMTAYIGLKKIGEMATGETVVTSAAAGAVGIVAGQIARLCGNRSVGIAGGQAKCDLVASLGMEPLDYKGTPDLGAAIRELCPEGVSVYFDNVGGQVLDSVLPNMAAFGRIVVCGMVADYNTAGDPYPIRNLWQVLVHRVMMRGFLTFEHKDMVAEAEDRLGGWIKSGELTALENVTTGIENTPKAFIALMSGRTTGKTILRTSEAVSCL